MDAVIVAATGPVVTAMLAALGFWLRDVRQRRNREQAYRQALDQAREQVAFIEEWLRSHQQLASTEQHEEARERALADLQQAYARVDQTLVAVRNHKQPLTARRVLARLLLLEAKPHTAAAKVLSMFYYVALAWLLLWVSAGVLFGLTGAATGTSNSLLSDLGFALGIFVLCLAVGVAPALPLYFSVVSVDRGHRGDPPATKHRPYPTLPAPHATQTGSPAVWEAGEGGADGSQG